MLDPAKFIRIEGLWQVPAQVECALRVLAGARI